MTAKRAIQPADIMDIVEYAKVRKQKRADLMPAKRARRVLVGPYATFHFESYATMWLQVHEMLYIERGGAAQIADELAAYNPLIPNGQELTATLMFEIEDPVHRAEELQRLTHVEDSISLQFSAETVKAVPEGDIERTKDDGRTSSVHFLHFPFTAAQIASFRDPDTQVVLAITHPHYGHMAVLSPATRAALAADFV